MAYSYLSLDVNCLYLEEFDEIVEDREEDDGDDVPHTIAHLNKIATQLCNQKID